MDQVRDPGNHSPYVPLVMTLESHRPRPIFVAQEPMACDLGASVSCSVNGGMWGKRCDSKR